MLAARQVDHFNYFKDERFSQRVIVSKDFWAGENYPVFFYAGNEGKSTGFLTIFHKLGRTDKTRKT